MGTKFVKIGGLNFDFKQALTVIARGFLKNQNPLNANGANLAKNAKF
jgi:hypothetical protein